MKTYLARLGLAQRFFLYIIPTALLGIFVLGTSAYLIFKNHILTSVQNEIQILGQNASFSLSAFFRQRKNDLLTVSESPLFTDYHNNRSFGLLQEAETYRQEIEHHLLTFCQRAGVYDHIVFVHADGAELCKIESSRIVRQRGRWRDPALLDRLRRMPASAHREWFSVRADDGRPTVSYAKPLFSPAGEFIGFVLMECSLKPVKVLLRGLRLGSSGWASLTDQDGRVLFQEGTPKPQGTGTLTSDASIGGTPWKVTVGAEAEEFLKPLGQIKVLTTTLGVFCGLLVTLFTYLRVQSLVRPIHHLVKATKRMEAGDLSGRVAVSRQDELGTLARSFNTMAESLEQRTRDLEARVRELTAFQEMETAFREKLDEETILRTCLEVMARGFSFDRAALYWVDHGKNEIVGRLLYGADKGADAIFTEASFRKRRTPLGGEDILNWVIRHQTPVLVKDPDRDPRMNRDYVREAKTREFVMAPIRAKGRTVGVFTADNYYSKRPLGEGDKEGLTLFANAVGLALENALLFQNLAESEARYRAVLENSPAAVIGLSREHWITTWNRGAEEMFGYSGAEIAGKPLTLLFAPGSEGEFRSLLSRLMEEGAVRDYPMPGMTKARKRLDLSLSWGGAHRDFWMNQEWAVVIRDVTEAKRLQQQLIRSEKHSAVGQLISSIAHELNNPLQAVVGYAQLLASEHQEPPIGQDRPGAAAASWRQDLRMIMESAIRCQKIIDNLLLFVRQGEVEKRSVHLEEAVRAALELLEYKLKKSASVEVTLRLPPGLPPAHANFQQLQQVFVNLINNACDAMSGWAGPKAIAVSARVDDDRLMVEVSDSGPGIPPDMQQRIFEPFFTTKPEGRGTGLGLAVCRQIVTEHGGSMGFRSAPGQGATFWIELPVSKKEEKPPPEEETDFPPVPGKAILLLDDEAPILSLLLKVLEKEGSRVETASSLKEATLKASQSPFDLVITDIRLGEGTGLDLYESWTALFDHPRPSFLFITGDVLNLHTLQSLEKKGLPILYKPVDLMVFRRVVRDLLNRGVSRL